MKSVCQRAWWLTVASLLAACPAPPPNPKPPVAVADAFQLTEDTTAAIAAIAAAQGVLANDGPVEAGALAAVLNTGPAGSDSFTYAANDGASQSAPATVTIAVAPVNDLPVATAVGPITTAEDTAAAAVQLAGTDVEDPAGVLTAVVATPPQHGQLSASSGSAPLAVTYTPAANYAGPDSFSFAIVDRNAGSSSPQLVNVTVTPVNDPPVARDDSPTAYQGVSIDLPVLTNDTDIDSVALAVTGATQPSHGTISFAADHVTYTPATGYTGPGLFTLHHLRRQAIARYACLQRLAANGLRTCRPGKRAKSRSAESNSVTPCSSASAAMCAS